MAAKQNKQTEQEEEKKDQTLPIFLGYNQNAANNLESKVNALLSEAQAVGAILTNAGVTLTTEIINDALTMKVHTEGDRFNAKDVFSNCTHLDEEFARILADEIGEVKSKLIKDNLTATLKQGEEKCKFDILRERAKYSEVEDNTEQTRKYLEVKDGVICLSDGYKEQIKEDTGFWITTDAQLKAYNDHKAAADAITEFLKNFPMQLWPRTLAELGNLFSADEESGGMKPAFMDYAYYIN